LIQEKENQGFKIATISYPTGPVLDTSIRNNERVKTEDPVLADKLWKRLEEFVAPYASHVPVTHNPKINYYKYGPGQRFNFHLDGTVRYDELRSFFTLLIYLNDEMTGGETVFEKKQSKYKARDRNVVGFSSQSCA